jgi:Helicase conserved C-terminal domain
VLATTSAGQEGLDFHQFCRAVVHWNLPSNPVDLEQRASRVHRYKGHAVQRILARAYGEVGLAAAVLGP